MNPSQEKLEVSQVVEVNWADRWQVYRRLQELSIPCTCEVNQPLRVQINNTAAALQLWSVCQQLTATRTQLLVLLKRCWLS